MSRLPVLALLLIIACTPAPTSDTAADEQAIRGKVDGMNQALTSQNDSAISMLYAPDGEAMPPNMPRAVGRPAVRALFAAIWPLKASLSLAPARIQVSGDWAIEEGNWNWTMPSPQGEMRDHGKYLVTWHRIDGDWLIAQDIWNSDAAPAAATPK